MLKSLALSLLLTVGSVAASPESLEGGLEARTIQCGNLAQRLVSKCVCTDLYARLDSTGKACACKSGYKQVGNKCVVDCGDSADYKKVGGPWYNPKYECVCQKSYLKYFSDRTCGCAEESKKDEDGSCQDICPAGSTWKKDGQSYKCECDDEKQFWDETKCSNKCPSDITDYHSADNEDGYVCTCQDDSKKFSNNECSEPKCEHESTKYDGMNGDEPICKPKCEDESTKYDGMNGDEPICKPKCEDESTKYDGMDGEEPKCKPKCESESTKYDGMDGEEPICKPKC
ncbi:hypothetical protein F66182_2046, partial [Fusarium sp. NRRL 66182]